MAVVRRSRLLEVSEAPLVHQDGSWRVFTEGLPFSDASDAGVDSSLSTNQRLPRVLPLIQQVSVFRGVGAPRLSRTSTYRPSRAPSYKYPPPNSGFWKEFNKLREYAPRRVLHCVKRKVRKEVLFAFKVAGKRGRSPGRGGGYRRTVYSQWSC